MMCARQQIAKKLKRHKMYTRSMVIDICAPTPFIFPKSNQGSHPASLLRRQIHPHKERKQAKKLGRSRPGNRSRRPIMN